MTLSMPDFIIEDRLSLIKEHIDIIPDRMKKIPTAQDFIATPDGQILYDSILVRLQSIGENIKKIESIRTDLPKSIFILTPGRSFGFET